MRPSRTSRHRAGSTSPPPCYWAQAQVVRHKICRHDYQCQRCAYDKALRRQAALNVKGQSRNPVRPKENIETWQDRLRQRPVLQRPCIHSMRGEITFRPCTENYMCAECDFHQYFQDIYSVHTVLAPVDVLEIRGFHVPQGFYLHPGHTWVKLESEDMVRIGLDEFAFKILGPLDAIQIPVLGKLFSQGRPGLSVEREGQTIAVLAPMSGVITDMHTAAAGDPARAQNDPYGDGWLLRIKATDLRRELPNLVLGAESAELVGREVDRVFALLEETCGPLAADGGDLIPDLAGHVPEVGWERLAGLVLGGE